MTQTLALKCPSTRTVFVAELLLAAAATLPIAACARFEPVTAAQLERGCVIMLPGVENGPSSMVGIAQGLRDGGIDHALQQELWGDRPFGALKNVSALERNRKLAADLAARIADYCRTHPHQAITIIGNSGGGGMAIFVCEALPKDVQVDRVILLAAAISPEYDLTPTLAHCRRGLVNFYSEGDWFDAGILTILFGTMDRKQHRPPAGKTRIPRFEGATRHQERPDPNRMGDPPGGSWATPAATPGWASRAWAREVLAPLILDEAKTPIEGNHGD